MSSSNVAPEELAVFGMEDGDDTLFYVIHGLALASLGISILISIAVLFYLLKSGDKNVFRKPIGERLVVYLAMVDLCYRYIFIVNTSFILSTYPNIYREF